MRLVHQVSHEQKRPLGRVGCTEAGQLRKELHPLVLFHGVPRIGADVIDDTLLHVRDNQHANR